jgi:hypothetical protein
MAALITTLPATSTVPCTGIAGQTTIVPNAKEAELLNQLKQELGTALTEGRHAAYPEVVGEINLLRHIRGLTTVKEAKKKFLAGLEMRAKYNLDDIRDEYAPKLDAMGYDAMWKWRNDKIVPDWDSSCGCRGVGAGWEEKGWPSRTLSGHMYAYVSIAEWKPGSKTEGMLSRVSDEETQRYQLVDIVIHQMRFDRISRHEGHMAKVSFVWDFEGVSSMFQMQNKEWKRRMDEMDALRGELHIEFLAKFYLINASWIVRKLYGIVRPLLPKRTANKVVVIGSDWRNEILKEFDPKVVALILKCSNKRGKEMNGGDGGDGQDDLIGVLNVKAGAKKEVIIDLDDAEEVIWAFKATSRDINFSATVTGSDGPEYIVETCRFSSEEGQIKGRLPNTKSGGILVLCWDNSHSWMWGNGVEYEITVVPKITGEGAEGVEGETKEI